jgi:hypothetical protein
MSAPSPYQPPRASLEMPDNKPPPTVGYLIGGFVQLALGGAMILVNVLGLAGTGGLLLGLIFIFLGLKTVIKYQKRTRTRPRA